MASPCPCPGSQRVPDAVPMTDTGSPPNSGNSRIARLGMKHRNLGRSLVPQEAGKVRRPRRLRLPCRQAGGSGSAAAMPQLWTLVELQVPFTAAMMGATQVL